MLEPQDAPPDGMAIEEVRALATGWAGDVEGIAGGMFDYLAEHIPEAVDDPEIAGVTLASCSANVEAMISMVRHGIPASATEAPVAALEHARRMAASGRGVDSTLRFYRLGHAYFWGLWSSALTEVITDRDRLAVALRDTAAFSFRYIDTVSARVGAEHVAERERRQRRAAIVRADVVRAVLAGEPVDHRSAERALGHALAGPQLAFVCWSTGDPVELERVALALAATVGSARPLLVPDGPHVLGGWVVPDGPVDVAASTAATRAASAEVHVAVGSPGVGLAGFRDGRLQADRARRIATLAEHRAPSLSTYADVALVDLLSRDVDAARAFVAGELGGLATAGPAAERVRAALLAVVAPQGGLAAAARLLGVHRNTVLQRVRRAEELRGRPATDRPAELHAALLLAAALGPAVLPG
ncbi:PucR family transcriptional regulator [Patulibacter minatonensis]|uniref:PucR family transcriptional regulator n=1 Tax=Patulibacter minatonensis TaxID=298163 RepID=UPI001B7F8CD8|nr:helix-turn-helix domain-containing protein [Patulibacter minatonensis]